MQSPLPPVIHSLRALSRILSKAEAHAAQRGIAPATLLQDRLFPDMFPLVLQVQIATGHAYGIGAYLTGANAPALANDETDFAQLIARVERVVAYLSTIPDADFAGAEDREVAFSIAGHDMRFTGTRYLHYFALPNFYFHMATAYNILRHNGVDLGKADFLGG